MPPRDNDTSPPHVVTLPDGSTLRAVPILSSPNLFRWMVFGPDGLVRDQGRKPHLSPAKALRSGLARHRVPATV